LYVEDGNKRVIFNDHYANHNTYCDWGKIKRCVPPGSLIHGPLLFLLYVYDLQKNHNTFKTVPFADDTGIIITNPNPFINEIKKVLKICTHTHTHTHIYIYMIGLLQTYYL
jgi:hypothetical protein